MNDLDNKELLKSMRKDAGLTQKMAAELSHTPYQTWLSWEDKSSRGRRVPGIALAWIKLYQKSKKMDVLMEGIRSICSDE